MLLTPSQQRAIYAIHCREQREAWEREERERIRREREEQRNKRAPDFGVRATELAMLFLFLIAAWCGILKAVMRVWQ